ncbi:sensor histidine kinase [Actinomadura rubrisoli]|uniref:histidine kinase n=1 Tax=Actinomadura rubrisoli TaxID=2530368 RepID=A0A4R5CB02_9ACTN|nr:HAMP domain-containing sensor histidine kinase [Actinomadura rubrisoli]TDD95380.1 HAMP domain-containing histidine kinase [Actinomadura rubrisoli]
MTVIAGAVTAVVCAVLAVLIVAGVRGRVADYKRQQATSAALQLVYLINHEEVPPELDAPESVVLQVLNPRGRVVAGTPGMRAKRPIARFVPDERSVYATKVLCPPAGLEGCMSVEAFRISEEDGDWTIYAAAESIPWYVSAGLCTFAISLSLLIVLLASLRTWRTVDQALAPVDAIRAELSEITARRSGHRVPVPENRDEIRLLAEAANATLDRLDAALARQRSFTSDASHDLRSPIAAARAQLEEALMYPDDVDWPRTGRTVLQSLDRLQAIVTDLLELARLDAEKWKDDETVDLGALVTIEVTRSERSKRIATHLQDAVTVRGDRLRLVRLLTNLLDNAERHADTQIDVTVRQEDGVAVLEVLDDGAGIAEADREVVFQRFARLRDAQARDANGTGLGLPIAREIATSHGGDLTIEDSERGARFVLRIPRDTPERDGKKDGDQGADRKR